MSPRILTTTADGCQLLDAPAPSMPRLPARVVPAILRRPALRIHCTTCGDTGYVFDADPECGVGPVERDCPAGCPATWVDGPADSGTADAVEAEAERLATLADGVVDEGDGDVDGGEWWEEVA